MAPTGYSSETVIYTYTVSEFYTYGFKFHYAPTFDFSKVNREAAFRVWRNAFEILPRLFKGIVRRSFIMRQPRWRRGRWRSTT